jgi:PAS domain S-box-containing protein
MLAKSLPPTRRFRLFSWPVVAAMLLLIQAALAITVPKSGTLTAYSIITFFLVLVLAAGIATLNALHNREAIRLFWSFLAMAFGAWSLNAWSSIYYVLALGRDRPVYLVALVPLFLHIVLMIAAVVSRPHLKLSRPRGYRTTLNFLLLLFFWIFAYCLVLVPYSEAYWDAAPFLRGEALYLAENVLLLVVLAVLILRAQPPWKSIYWHLLGASALYVVGSLTSSILVAFRGYYSGLRDIPYAAAAYWFVWVALRGRKLALQLAQSVQPDTGDTKYASLLAMLAVLGVPVVGVWELFRADEPYRTRVIRLLIVLLSVLLLAVFVFVKEYLASRELSSDVGLANERLRSAMESGKAVGWEQDLKSGRNSWFGDLQTMFGIPSDTFVGGPEDFYRHVHPEDRQQFSDAVADARKNHKQYAAEFRVVWPDGTVRWAVASGRFHYSKKNGAERMLGMAVDVTDRKQAEEAQRRHDAIVEFSEDAIISEDLDGVIRSWNRGAQRLFGFSKEEAIGKPIAIVVPDELQAEENENLARLRAGQPIEHYDTVHITKEQQKIDVFLTVSPIRNSAGKVVGASRIARDITERRRGEDSLRESEQRFRLVANSAPVMIWMSGPDKLCTYFNQPWLEFTGRSIEAELGNGWTDGVHPNDLQACLESYAKAFDRQESFKIEYRLRRHDGEYRWVFDTGVPRFSAHGSFAGYIGSCIDVSDRKLAEESLSSVSRRLIEAHEEERTRIARELHDDINQRIALLAVNLERLKQDLPAGVDTGGRIDEVRELVSEIGSDVQSLSHRLHSSKLDYLGLGAAAASFCRELSDRQKVEIDFHAVDVPKKLPREISLCLFRVLQEGLQNAVKHSGSRQFQVWLGGASHEISLSVSDSGVGFDPDVAFQGQGLGLTSMKERVKLVGGEFSIDSQLDCGTTIHARVPLGLAAISAYAGGSKH